MAIEFTAELAKLVLENAYREAVPDPKSLNLHYQLFSSDVYGETSFEFILNLIEEKVIDLDSGEDVFSSRTEEEDKEKKGEREESSFRSPPPKAARKETIKLGDSPIAEKRKREG